MLCNGLFAVILTNVISQKINSYGESVVRRLTLQAWFKSHSSKRSDERESDYKKSLRNIFTEMMITNHSDLNGRKNIKIKPSKLCILCTQVHNMRWFWKIKWMIDFKPSKHGIHGVHFEKWPPWIQQLVRGFCTPKTPLEKWKKKWYNRQWKWANTKILEVCLWM